MKKRSFSIAGHRTSIALEEEFWAALEAQARKEHLSLPALIAFSVVAQLIAVPVLFLVGRRREVA